MGMINKRTQINELRILAVESHMKMTNEADGNVENKLSTKLFTSMQTTLIRSFKWINLASTIRFSERKNMEWRKC